MDEKKVRVLDDGPKHAYLSRPPRRPLLLAAAGILVGGVALLVVSSTGSSGGAGSSTVPPLAATTTTTVADEGTATTSTTTSSVSPPSDELDPRTSTTVDAGVSTSVLAGGSSVSDVRLADGSRFALFLPAVLGDGFELTGQTQGGAVALLSGDSFTASIRFGYCSGVTQDRAEISRLGTVVDTSDPNRTVACRPDQFLVVEIATADLLTDDDAQDIHIVPLVYGNEYSAQMEVAGAQCCVESLGPLYIGADLIVVGNGFLDGQVTALDASSLAPRWSTVVGDESFVYGVTDTDSPVVIASPHFGRLVGLSPDSGQEQWRVELGGGFLSGLSAGRGGVWFVATDYGGEGDATPPVLRAIDTSSGETMWTREGIDGTDWQWGQPTLVDDVVIMLDVPNPWAGAKTASLLAFDADTGGLRWVSPLDSPSEAFAFDRVVTDSTREPPLILVATVDGDVIRVDPATGTVIWRTSTGFSQIIGLSPTTVTVRSGSTETDLDLASGLVR